MQNVLNFPNKKQQQKKEKALIPFVAACEKIFQFFKRIKEYKEHDYKIKCEFLKNECYKVYLKQILEKRHLLKIIDIPEFFYLNGWTVDSEAMSKAEAAIKTVEEKFGRKHIERCYNARIKQIIKNLKSKK